MIYQVGSEDVFANVSVFDNETGEPVTDLEIGSPLQPAIKYQVDNGSIVTLAPASMSAGGAHVDGGIYHVGAGDWKIGVPDAAFLAPGVVRVWLEKDGVKAVADALRVVDYDPEKVVAEGRVYRWTRAGGDVAYDDTEIGRPS